MLRWRRRRASTTSALDATGHAQALDASASCDSRVNNTFDKLLECVTLDGVRAHQAALQAIADANGGTRAAGTPGYDAERRLRVDEMTAAGYNVTLNAFPFVFVAPAAAAADRADRGNVRDRLVHRHRASADVTRRVTAVDINLAPPRASTSGCEAADFAGFPAGNIALIQRGTCTFADKALNAQAAGAVGGDHLQPGQHPGPRGSDHRHAGAAVSAVTIPVVGASFADGAALAQAGLGRHVVVDRAAATSRNTTCSPSRGRATRTTS